MEKSVSGSIFEPHNISSSPQPSKPQESHIPGNTMPDQQSSSFLFPKNQTHLSVGGSEAAAGGGYGRNHTMSV